MARYIDPCILAFKLESGRTYTTGEVRDLINDAPAADVKEAVRGYWIRFSSDEFCCSNCGEVRHYDTLDGVDPDKFCPECGADMGVE